MEIFGPSPLVRLGKSASNLFRKNGMPIFELRVGSIHAKMSTTLKEEKFYHAECYKYLVLARDFVEIPDSDSLDLVEGLTVEMWLYLEAWSTAGGTGATKELSYKVGPRDNKKVLIRLTTDKQAWGAAVVHGKTEMPLKKWMHVAGTYDGKSGEGKIYINGVIDGEGKIGGNIVPNNDVLWLGRGAGPFLQGRMDEVRISNIARSEEEIQELMNKGIKGVLAVKSQDKLATTWGKLKSNLAR